MDDWSSQSKSPQKMWDELKKLNPQLDEKFYRLPDGRWDSNRLNAELDRINRAKQAELDEHRRIAAQRTFERQQIKANKREQKRFQKGELSRQIDLNLFKTGLYMFMIPPLIQFLILLTVYFLPLMKGLELFWNLIPLLLILNLLVWISIPIMTTQLAKQINRLDNRTKDLI